MGSVTDKWNTVEIHREGERSPDNYVKIDGVKIHGMTNIEIKYGIEYPYPHIKIEFWAKKITGKVEGIFEKEASIETKKDGEK